MSQIRRAALILVSFWFISECRCAKILIVAPAPSRSHYILGNKICRELANVGHNITLISPYDDVFQPKNGSFRVIHLTDFESQFNSFAKERNYFEMGNINAFLTAPYFLYMILHMTHKTVEHPNVQKLLNSGEKFDIVLVEEFGSQSTKAFAPHFGAHLMTFSSIVQSFWTDSLTGAPTLPSFAPEPLLNYHGDMSFFQRVQNTLMRTLLNLASELYLYPRHAELVHKYISPNINLYDVMYNSSINFVNTHVSVSPALPIAPNMVFIGGFHLDEAKSLPLDLQGLMDKSTNGVVLFSMGSILKSKDLPVKKREAILKVFGDLKETVIWKYEDNKIEGLPTNVHIMKWLPQADLLAHPNLKLFITHAGYGSTTETIFNGKPTLAMPVFGDQYANANTLKFLGVSEVLPFAELSEESFRSALSNVLNNPQYTKKAKEVSILYKGRKVKPIDEVIYWVDYVVRHNGAPHMRAVSLDLPWYQLYLIDVLLFLICVTIGGIFLAKKMCFYLLKRICGGKAMKEKTN